LKGTQIAISVMVWWNISSANLEHNAKQDTKSQHF